MSALSEAPYWIKSRYNHYAMRLKSESKCENQLYRISDLTVPPLPGLNPFLSTCMLSEFLIHAQVYLYESRKSLFMTDKT